MVRRRLCGDADAGLTCAADRFDGASGRDVGDVEMRARPLREAEIAGDHDLFGDRRISGQAEARRDGAFVDDAVAAQTAILGVHDHRRIDQRRILEHPPHHPCVHDRRAVVAEGDRSGVAQRDHLRHHLAREPARRRRDRPDPRERFLLRAIEDVHRDRRVVVDRIRVRHAGNLGEAARDGGGTPAAEILLVLLAGRAQMGVQIDEPRDDPGAGCLEDLGPVGRELRSDRRDAAVLDQTVEGIVAVLTGIEQAAPADEDARHRLTPPLPLAPRGSRSRPPCDPAPPPGRAAPCGARRRCGPDRGSRSADGRRARARARRRD